MDEPQRIGLTEATGVTLDELLSQLNPEEGEDGTRLIKFDLYRLAVAIGIKNQISPPALTEKSVNNLRVNELDQDGALYTAVENSDLLPPDTAIYHYIERLAEDGIKKFYTHYQQTGEFPLEETLGE